MSSRSVLSQCIHAVAALLYPFTWAHTYIPVVPECLLDTVCCPTPFMVGIQMRHLERVLDQPMEEVFEPGRVKVAGWRRGFVHGPAVVLVLGLKAQVVPFSLLEGYSPDRVFVSLFLLAPGATPPRPQGAAPGPTALTLRDQGADISCWLPASSQPCRSRGWGQPPSLGQTRPLCLQHRRTEPSPAALVGCRHSGLIPKWVGGGHGARGCLGESACSTRLLSLLSFRL